MEPYLKPWIKLGKIEAITVDAQFLKYVVALIFTSIQVILKYKKLTQILFFFISYY